MGSRVQWKKIEVLEMRGPKTTIFSLMAMAGGVLLYRKLKNSADSPAKKAFHDAVLPTTKKETDDALVDAMSEQSFPASDAPAY